MDGSLHGWLVVVVKVMAIDTVMGNFNSVVEVVVIVLVVVAVEAGGVIADLVAW